MANIRRSLAVLLAAALLIGCISVVFAADGSEEFGISSAFLRINEDINVVYSAKIPAGATDPYMVFTMCGISYTTSTYTVGSDGKYNFTFPKVTAVHMADNISATLYATYGGQTLTDTIDTYSVKAYCERMLTKYADDAALKTLLSDMLTYGAAAQSYIGYNTSALPTAGLELTPSTFTALPKQKAVLTGEKSDDVDWTSATIGLSNDLLARFYFVTDSVDGLTVEISKDDATETFGAADFGTTGNGKYFVSLTNIKATEFDETLTASFKRNGTPVGRTVSYSVNTYISSMQDCGNASLEALVKALYNYGAAAVAYTGSSADDPDQLVCDHAKCPVCGGCLEAVCDCEKVDCCTPCSCTSYTISEVEAIDAWIGNPGFDPTVETENAPVGDAWLLSGSEAWPVFVSAFAPFNIAKFADGYLHMWLYVEDSSTLAAGEIELSSASAPDNQEVSWALADLNLQTGWNELYLPFATANRVGGDADFTAFNYIRIYAGSYAENRIGIDKLEAVLEKPDIPEPPAPTSCVVWQGEALDAWIGTNPAVQTTGAPNGSAYLLTDADFWPTFASAFTPMDISSFADSGCLHMWLYVAKAADVVGGQIEMSSALAPDAEETSWDLTSLDLQDGWNELYLPFATANKVGGTTNFAQFNYMRIFAGLATPAVFGIDKIEVLPETPAQPIVIWKGEALDAWIGTTPAVQTTGAPVGSAYLQTAADYWPTFASAFTPFDISDYAEEGCLHLWLYVPAAADVVGGQIELTSSYAPDANEISWNMVELGLEDGWNELYLPFASANHVGGEIDFTAANYMRIFAGLATPAVFGIDRIEVLPTTPPAPVKPVVLWQGEALNAFIGNQAPSLEGVGAADGSVWLKTVNEGWPTLVSGFTPAYDISQFAENGYLHLWLYVPNAANVVGGEIELTSSFTVDNQETSWAMLDLNLHDGWNELYLPFASANHVGGDTDYTAVNYIRIYAGIAGEGYIGIDKIEAVATKP